MSLQRFWVGCRQDQMAAQALGINAIGRRLTLWQRLVVDSLWTVCLIPEPLDLASIDGHRGYISGD